MSELDTSKAPMTPEEQKAYQARQRHRATIMAAILVFLVILFYFITFVKIGSAF